jgi:uncharacterized oxidoreductase
VNNMLSVVFDPGVFGGAEFFQADIERLIEWTRASPPVMPNEPVLLPGEVELRTRRDREAHGIPIDTESWSQISAKAIQLGVAMPADMGAVA